MKMVEFTMDGRQGSVPEGTTILAAAESRGIEIPTLCYERDLVVAGACRVCVVEVEQIKKNLPAACAQPVGPGMVIHTNSPRVKEARRTILELIIANHPLDCLT